MKNPRHVFAIPAYKESPYLEECIISLAAQRTPGDIVICTSTPNGYINSLAEKYGLRLFVREGRSSLREDWNFAIDCAADELSAELVTVAHQDDIYHEDYRTALFEAFERYPDMSLFCTRYETIDKDGKRIKGRAESVKRILRLPLRLRSLSDKHFIKELPLRFGNGIGCPSCTYNIRLTGRPVFFGDHSFVTDWEALLRLSGMKGRFICDERELLSYRVHELAATNANIKDHRREAEEREIFERLWPKPVADMLMIPYKKSYKAYDFDGSK